MGVVEWRKGEIYQDRTRKRRTTLMKFFTMNQIMMRED